MSVEFTQRWIVNDNWTYTADLSSLLGASHTPEKKLLVFYGLDTVANIVRTSMCPIQLALNKMRIDCGGASSRLGQQPVPTICL